MRRKLLALMLTAAMLFAFIALPTYANADLTTITIKLAIGSKTVYVNGTPTQMDVAPFIDPHSNRTLVPVRFVAEGLGGEVSWHPKERFVGVRVGLKKVGLWIGSKTAKVSSQLPDWHKFDEFATKETDQAPEIVPPGRTMIPLRFVSESIGAKVDWNGQTREITISLSYAKPQLGDVLMSIPFDRGATATTGYCMAPGSAFAVDEKDHSIFVYGEKRIKPPNGLKDRQYDIKHEYLFKYDSLTGIRIAKKLLFDDTDPGLYGTTGGYSVVNWLAYNNGYLYCATQNFGAVYGLVGVKLYIKKVNPVTMSVVWFKSYDVQKTLYPFASPDKNGRSYFAISDSNRTPLKFTDDGSKMIIIFSSDMQAVIKNRYASYEFVNLLGIDTKTGNIAWKALHDGWYTSAPEKNVIPQYKDKIYLFETTFPSWAHQNLNDPNVAENNGYYSYQSIYLTKLTNKLIQESHVKSNLRPPFDPPGYMPERVMCIDMNTGKTVWQKFFLDNRFEYQQIEGDFEQHLYIVNGILYFTGPTYDKGVVFSSVPNDENYGTELLRFDALTGKELPLFHKPLMYYTMDWERPFVFDYNGVPKTTFDCLTGETRIKNGYIFNTTQNNGVYDPHQTTEDTVSDNYALVRYAKIDDIPLKDPDEISNVFDTTWYRYKALYAPFTYKYYHPDKKPSVPVRDSEPNNFLLNTPLKEGKDSFYFFFKNAAVVVNHKKVIVYPAIVEMKAVP